MRAAYMLIVALLAALTGDYLVESYRTLPLNLRECYTDDGTFVPALPLSLQVILDIIRKLERQTTSSMSMRTLSGALIKSLKLDGIVYSSDLPAREGVLRYAARGEQRAKNRIVEELVPGDASLLTQEMLTKDEKCALHFALSNTIWDHYQPSEEMLCRPPPTEKFSGSLLRATNVPGRSVKSNSDSCPKEGGVLLTPYGTISLGSVITAIAAALEPQVVKIKLLLSMPADEADTTESKPKARIHFNEEAEDVDFVIPKSEMNASRSMWLESVRISDTQIDNVWIATIAGELAEMVIYQGPIYEDRMYLGATGYWNSTIQPRIYYVTHPRNNFDVTRAEIVGGVDGLIIAKNLDNWMKKFENLRLSQVLEMYYSEKGIVFDKNVKACQRGSQFPRIGPKSILEEQTYAAAQVLAYLNSIAAMSLDALQRMVVRSVENFSHYTEDHLFTAVQCRGRRRRQTRVELVLAFDGSWTREYTADVLAVLVDDFDVSVYGSKMGMIHGESGQWLLNITSSPSDAYQAINNLAYTDWPKTMNLPVIFENVLTYLDKRWETIQNNNTIGNFGQAVVLLVPQLTLNSEEMDLALNALKKLKSKHPEVHFLYYTVESKAELFKPFILSDEDRIVKTLDVDDISRLLSTVPTTLRPAGCNVNIRGVRYQMEDYITPSETIVYRLHPQSRIKTKKVTITLHGVGYGTLKVCSWNQWRIYSTRLGYDCKDLSLYGDVTLTDEKICDQDGDCPNTYFQIMNVSSVTRCTEMDCKSPDQVRYIVRMENFQCTSSSTRLFINLFLIISFLILTSF